MQQIQEFHCFCVYPSTKLQLKRPAEELSDKALSLGTFWAKYHYQPMSHHVLPHSHGEQSGKIGLYHTTTPANTLHCGPTLYLNVSWPIKR